MQLTTPQRKKIVAALLAQRNNYQGTDIAFSKVYNLNNAAYSQLKNGKIDKVVGDDKLISIGRMLQVDFTDNEPWVFVKTETSEYITTQLQYCQRNSEARILVDQTEIGKTETAKLYALNNRNVFYVDCSQFKSKKEFVRELGRAVGVDVQARVLDVIKDTKYMLSLLENPLVILDEAGDLAYDAWLELKAFWNALEDNCGWYMMGADGLKAKVDRHIRSKKVGYAEIFSRYGKDYKKSTPADPVELAKYLREEAKKVAMANLNDKSKVNEVVNNSKGLRQLKANIRKANKLNKAA